MLTFLDLLVIVFMVLATLSLLSLCMMFLLKNKIIKRICFYVVLALAVYVTYVSLYIGFAGWFPAKMLFGVVTALMCIGALILDIIAKDNDRIRLIARIVATAALVIGMINAIL